MFGGIGRKAFCRRTAGRRRGGEIRWMRFAVSTSIAQKRRFRLIALAARLGLEPRQNESESFVLPLHHQAVVALRAASLWCTAMRFARAGMRGRLVVRWSRRWDSNPQPPVYKTGALPLSYAGERGSTGQNCRIEKNVSPLTPLAGWWLPGDSNPEPID